MEPATVAARFQTKHAFLAQKFGEIVIYMDIFAPKKLFWYSLNTIEFIDIMTYDILISKNNILKQQDLI